jgi:biotin operon repressor
MKGDFAMVPMAARHLSPSALKVLFWLCLTARASGKTWWSQYRIASVLDMSRTTVKRAEQELLTAGFLEPVEDGNRKRGYYVREPVVETLDGIGQKMAHGRPDQAKKWPAIGQKMACDRPNSGHKPEKEPKKEPYQRVREVEQLPDCESGSDDLRRLAARFAAMEV